MERKVDLSAAVGRNNLETELFVVADLDPVWVDLAISPADLVLGQSDERRVEVLSGLRSGKAVAIANTLLLKAELLKALAED